MKPDSSLLQIQRNFSLQQGLKVHLLQYEMKVCYNLYSSGLRVNETSKFFTSNRICTIKLLLFSKKIHLFEN